MRESDTIRASSACVRTVLSQCIERMRASGLRLVVIEGMFGAGKTHLVAGLPFTIEADAFLCRPVSPDTVYCQAIDQRALRRAIILMLDVYPVVIVEGPMVWPLLLPFPLPMARRRVRHIYLKRMMHRNPDLWQDERVIGSKDLWPQSAYARSVVRYHHDTLPWLSADLVIERVEPAA